MPAGAPARRVVVTGLGVISCIGSDLDSFYKGLCAAAPERERRVEDFSAETYMDAKEARQTDRFAQFSIASADLALRDAGELGLEPSRVGVIFGTGVGGLETLQDQIVVLAEKGPRRVSPRLVPMIMGNAGAAAISMHHVLRGPCETIVTACAAGAQSIGNAYRLIASGRCEAMVTGGAEAAMSAAGGLPSIGIAAFSNMTALSRSGISRPFDVGRDGFVIAEGGAALVLEELEHARARGAHIYAELLGAASNADAFHITAPAPGGAGAAECMRLALEDAGIEAGDVVHINAHGTSTPANDLAESEAIVSVFGDTPPPVTSFKGVTGHALAGAGAIEAVGVCLSLQHGEIPPTAGLTNQDPEIHLDVVSGAPRAFTPGPVLSNSFGFGGHNGCLVFAPLAA